MEHWKKRQQEADKRLRGALDKPVPPEEIYIGVGGYFDPWSDLMDGIVGPYNSEIDELAIDVLKAVRDRTTFDLLHDPRRALAAEMLMHMLAVWLCDYGTSPRGIFPASDGVRDMWDELIAKWEAFAEIAWGEAAWPRSQSSTSSGLASSPMAKPCSCSASEPSTVTPIGG